MGVPAGIFADRAMTTMETVPLSMKKGLRVELPKPLCFGFLDWLQGEQLVRTADLNENLLQPTNIDVAGCLSYHAGNFPNAWRML